MPVTPLTPIRIGPTFECFYFRVYMLNDNPPPRKPFIIRFFPLSQLMVFTWLYRNETVWVVFFYPKISPISVKGYRIAEGTPDAVLIHLEAMPAAFGFLYIKYFPGIPLNDDPGLQRMALFFPNTTLFDLLSGCLRDFP
jgi:hypothetical protein